MCTTVFRIYSHIRSGGRRTPALRTLRFLRSSVLKTWPFYTVIKTSFLYKKRCQINRFRSDYHSLPCFCWKFNFFYNKFRETCNLVNCYLQIQIRIFETKMNRWSKLKFDSFSLSQTCKLVGLAMDNLANGKYRIPTTVGIWILRKCLAHFHGHLKDDIFKLCLPRK